MRAQALLLAAMLGMAGGMGFGGGPPSVGGVMPLRQGTSSGGGRPGYESTKRGGQMQRFGVKKLRNRKGQSR